MISFNPKLAALFSANPDPVLIGKPTHQLLIVQMSRRESSPPTKSAETVVDGDEDEWPFLYLL